MDPFDRATVFDCEDSEELTHTEIEDCIESFLDSAWNKGEAATETLARVCPIVVTGYVRGAVPPDWAGRQAATMLDDLRERWYENFGDINGDHEPWTDAELALLTAMFTATIDAAVEYGEVWRCSAVGTRTYEFGDVIALELGWMDEC